MYFKNKHIVISHTHLFAKRQSFTHVTYLHICHFFSQKSVSHTDVFNQGLWASSLQFTSPVEFSAIFRDGFTLRHELTAGSKIRDPVLAKFKHVTNIVICLLLCCDYVTYVPALKFQKSWLNPRLLAKNTPVFLFPQMGHSLQIFV